MSDARFPLSPGAPTLAPMLMLALLLVAQEGNRFVVPDELLGDEPQVTAGEDAVSAVPS